MQFAMVSAMQSTSRDRKSLLDVDPSDGSDPKENFRVARERVVAAIRANELPLGIKSTDLIGGFEGIKWRYVEDLEGAAARISFDVVSEHRGSRRPGNITIRVDAQGASTLGEAYDSVGYELRHLSEDNIMLSDVDPPGPALSPQEADAV